MPKLRVFCILVLGATVTRAAAGQSVGSQVRPLLSKGPARVEVMKPWAPPRLNELSVRVQRAAQADPRWWEDRVRNAGSGPLPYDPKLGITENEYRELQRLADSVQLRPARTETIDIEFTPTGWRFGRATTLFALRGLEIDTVANKIVSSFGDLPAGDPIVPRPTQRATGPWAGPQWSLEAFDPSTRTGTRAAFAVGKHQLTGHTVIYLNAQRVVNGQMTSRESLFLRVVR